MTHMVKYWRIMRQRMGLGFSRFNFSCCGTTASVTKSQHRHMVMLFAREMRMGDYGYGYVTLEECGAEHACPPPVCFYASYIAPSLFEIPAQESAAHNGSGPCVPGRAPHAPALRRSGSSDANTSSVLFCANNQRESFEERQYNFLCKRK